MTLYPKKMKVNELRVELEKRKLNTTGLKSDLVQRLELALDEEEFGNHHLDPEDRVHTDHTNNNILCNSNKANNKERLKSPEPSPRKNEKNKNTDFKDVIKNRYHDKDKESSSAVSNNLKSKDEIKTEKDSNISAEKNNTIKTIKNNNLNQKDDNINHDKSVILSEEEKKQKRAEKFGVLLSEKDKQLERAKRFNLPVSNGFTAEELEKKRKRAERFQLVTSEILDEKKKLRAERFGLNEQDDKKRKRAERFNIPTTEILEDKKRKRAERFGLQI